VQDETPEVEEKDPTEVIRLMLIGIGLALNVALLYWQFKDTAEVMIWRQRVVNWRKARTDARAKARADRLAEGHVVLEAMQVVDGAV
jgi:hypothetical protein